MKPTCIATLQVLGRQEFKYKLEGSISHREGEEEDEKDGEVDSIPKLSKQIAENPVLYVRYPLHTASTYYGSRRLLYSN